MQRMGALLGAAALGACDQRSTADGPPPETAHIRIVKIPGICLAPQYVAEDLLRAEGFLTVEYVPLGLIGKDPLSEDRADIAIASAPALLSDWEAGTRAIALAGIHKGCYELFA